MSTMRSVLAFSALTHLFAVSASAAPGLADPPPPVSIEGGEPAPTCAWPTTLRTTSIAGIFAGPTCTAVLIHPQLFATYGMCPGFPDAIQFGEAEPFVEVEPMIDVAPDGTLVPVCAVDPSGRVTVCALDEPVLDVPLTPIVYGCEREILAPGRAAAMVGFGPPTTGAPDGVKHWAPTVITQVHDDDVLAFDGGQSATCEFTDAGAPLFVEYPDGSWHVVGVGSSNSCGGEGSVFERLDTLVPWIEEEFSVDVTPCHDVDGNWSPTEACGNFDAAGPEGSGTWETWCSDDAALEYSATCGAAWGEEPDPQPEPGTDTSTGGSDDTTSAPADTAEPVGTDETTHATSSDDSGTSDAGYVDGTEGCGCRSTSAPTSALAFVALAMMSRRRRSRLAQRSP